MYSIKKMLHSVKKCTYNYKQSYLFDFSLIRTLTERIVLVLSRMKCAHAIEPYQIQGGDFIHVFPVVQWLVKRVYERRAEIGSFNRAYALDQYSKLFGPSIDEVRRRRHDY